MCDIQPRAGALPNNLRFLQTNEQIDDCKDIQVQFDSRGAVHKVNEYELLRELGAGATAVVKLCRRVGAPRVDADGGGNGVLYAVKIFQKNVLRKQVDFGARPGEMVKETGLHKLQREIAIMKKLIHPNIVRLIEVIDDEGGDCGYLVMEYVSGGAVMEFDEVRKAYVFGPTRGSMPKQRAASIFVDVLAGLHFLHINGVIHRDIKPDNILIAKDGTAKLADFGMAHHFADEKRPGSTYARAARSKSKGQVKDTQ
eukprot:11383-Heterococcus_DN1.PRE.1